jgi:hypothetical protein
MITPDIAAKIHAQFRHIERNLDELKKSAEEHAIDAKCQEIQQRCAWIEAQIGTGDAAAGSTGRQ